MNPQTPDKFQDPFRAGVINIWSLNSPTLNIAISVDDSHTSRGWNSSDSIVVECFKNTSKVIDIIYKKTKCRECYMKKREVQSESIEEIDYNELYVHQEQAL